MQYPRPYTLAWYLVMIRGVSGTVSSWFLREENKKEKHKNNIGLHFIGWRSGESARLPPMCPGRDSRTRRHMRVEFVVGSLLCFERFFSGYSDFPLSSKTNIFNFQFDPDYCQALYHEPLARVIARALLVFDVKFAFFFSECREIRKKILIHHFNRHCSRRRGHGFLSSLL